MTRVRPTLVVCGDVVVAWSPEGARRARAVGIAGGRVVAVGTREDVLDAMAPGGRVVDVGEAAVVPGMHDFHIHLVGLARSRVAVAMDDASPDELVTRLNARAEALPAGAWVTGRGWSERQLEEVGPEVLERLVNGRPAWLVSHDGHSAWASVEARRRAGLTGDSADPPGGRIERGPDGLPTGVLRETAMELVAPHVDRLQGEALRAALDAVLRELAALGVTGATEAGDYTAENGVGDDAVLGDSYSTLTDLAALVDGRLRLTLGIPADGLGAAAERGLRTGLPLPARRTMRFGWAKEYADGALGSGTAALFEPTTCGHADGGILRVTDADLDGMVRAGREAGIGLAIHAIGDRAAAAVLDALERGGPRHDAVPPDRMEHLQLVRPAERERLKRLGVLASIQPIHAAADRDMVDACWSGREEDAYAWRALRRAGVPIVSGSDAPVESADPWLGVFAAVHRRFPGDGRDDWRPEQALTAPEVLESYTLAPGRAIGAADEGHLDVGARADLAVLDVDVPTLLHADEGLARIRSELTLVDGQEVPLA